MMSIQSLQQTERPLRLFELSSSAWPPGCFSKRCKSNFGEDAGTLGAHGDYPFATLEVANVRAGV
jgi:hypothetical protein